MLPIPLPPEALQLADWLELVALLSSDRNASIGDLGRALAVSNALEAEAGDADNRLFIEARGLEVWREIEARAAAAGPAYPYRLSQRGLLEANIARDAFSAYRFCLSLSYFGDPGLVGVNIRPRRLFEDLATLAAGNHLGGEACRFGSPRADLPAPFREALREVCSRLGEGAVLPRATRSIKDDGLDVVAWKHFPDRLPGKLIIFGQCASGNDWNEKLADLEPLAFCHSWLSHQLPSRVLKAFFTPHRVDRLDWDDVNRRAGLFFDRCRLAYWVHNGAMPANTQPYIEWCEAVLAQAAERVA